MEQNGVFFPRCYSAISLRGRRVLIKITRSFVEYSNTSISMLVFKYFLKYLFLWYSKHNFLKVPILNTFQKYF